MFHWISPRKVGPFAWVTPPETHCSEIAARGEERGLAEHGGINFLQAPVRISQEQRQAIGVTTMPTRCGKSQAQHQAI
jgi:hypothetical protein